jgi:hypothetical protein
MYQDLQPDETFLGQPNPWPGWLPDDIRIEGGNFHFYFPLGMCLLLSLIQFLIRLLRGQRRKCR